MGTSSSSCKPEERVELCFSRRGLPPSWGCHCLNQTITDSVKETREYRYFWLCTEKYMRDESDGFEDCAWACFLICVSLLALMVVYLIVRSCWHTFQQHGKSRQPIIMASPADARSGPASTTSIVTDVAHQADLAGGPSRPMHSESHPPLVVTHVPDRVPQNLQLSPLDASTQPHPGMMQIMTTLPLVAAPTAPLMEEGSKASHVQTSSQSSSPTTLPAAAAPISFPAYPLPYLYPYPYPYPYYPYGPGPGSGAGATVQVVSGGDQIATDLARRGAPRFTQLRVSKLPFYRRILLAWAELVNLFAFLAIGTIIDSQCFDDMADHEPNFEECSEQPGRARVWIVFTVFLLIFLAIGGVMASRLGLYFTQPQRIFWDCVVDKDFAARELQAAASFAGNYVDGPYVVILPPHPALVPAGMLGVSSDWNSQGNHQPLATVAATAAPAPVTSDSAEELPAAAEAMIQPGYHQPMMYYYYPHQPILQQPQQNVAGKGDAAAVPPGQSGVAMYPALYPFHFPQPQLLQQQQQQQQQQRRRQQSGGQDSGEIRQTYL